jgi:hypothetical protein
MGMARSTNRKNRVLRAPATTDSCDIGAGDPEGSPFAFWCPFRRDRVLRLPDLNLVFDGFGGPPDNPQASSLTKRRTATSA